MKVETYTNAADFINAAGDVLKSDEARYGLIYGIARRVVEKLHYYGEEDPLFYTVFDGNTVNALAWRTPPFPVGLAWHAGEPKEAVSLLIGAIRERWAEIPGVLGEREITTPFAEKWCRTFGTSIKSTMAQRIYRLDTVNDVTNVSGEMRSATPEDKDLISEWRQAFFNDIYGESQRDKPDIDFTPNIEKGDIYLWEDAGKPVSIAIKSRPTEHGMTISMVYTPREQRRRGYATACVAGVCREILKSGYDFCTLYTDLSNPTSNSIYMKIGFKPVCDSVEYIFS
jgi:predicted GNAT family acetyltransferase